MSHSVLRVLGTFLLIILFSYHMNFRISVIFMLLCLHESFTCVFWTIFLKKPQVLALMASQGGCFTEVKVGFSAYPNLRLTGVFRTSDSQNLTHP